MFSLQTKNQRLFAAMMPIMMLGMNGLSLAVLLAGRGTD